MLSLPSNQQALCVSVPASVLEITASRTQPGIGLGMIKCCHFYFYGSFSLSLSWPFSHNLEKEDLLRVRVEVPRISHRLVAVPHPTFPTLMAANSRGRHRFEHPGNDSSEPRLSHHEQLSQKWIDIQERESQFYMWTQRANCT